MSLPRRVAEILREHVALEVEGTDRMYLTAYVPGLQYTSGLPPCSGGTAVSRSPRRRCWTPSARLSSPRFTPSRTSWGVPLVTFEKGQRKDAAAATVLFQPARRRPDVPAGPGSDLVRRLWLRSARFRMRSAAGLSSKRWRSAG